MKEDHLQDARLNSAYNVQMGTENQSVVVGYRISKRRTVRA
jgi:hypothetical protein